MHYGAEVYAINGEGNEAYYAHINAVCDKHPTITMDDGADVISVLHGERTDQLTEVIGGTEETTTGVIRLRALEAEGKLGVPDRRGQRGEHEAHVRQPLRHRPVHARRDHPRDEHPDRRQARGRVRLRLVRQGRRDAREGPRRARDRVRGRPAEGARGRDGRLRGDARHRGRARGRHLHHRHRRHARARRPATSA